MFKNKICAKYKIVALDRLLEKQVEEAEEKVRHIEEEIEKVQKEFNRLADLDETPDEKLFALEDKIEKLEKERDEAIKEYDRARHLTLEDLKADKRYEDWKGSR